MMVVLNLTLSDLYAAEILSVRSCIEALRRFLGILISLIVKLGERV